MLPCCSWVAAFALALAALSSSAAATRFRSSSARAPEGPWPQVAGFRQFTFEEAPSAVLHRSFLDIFLRAGSEGKGADVANDIAVTVRQSNATSMVRPGAFVHQPLSCGTTVVVTASSEQHVACPKECPLLAEDTRTNLAACDFHCVGDSVESCKSNDPDAPVPDTEMGACRACVVHGCSQCSNDGTDTCARCSRGFKLRDGECHSSFAWIFYVCFGVLGILVAVVLAWVLNLNCRAITNAAGLKRGLDERSRAKLHMPADPDNPREKRQYWPLKTNLCTTLVGGNGILLLFNFQAMLIIWGVVLAIVWCCFIFFVDADLAILGTQLAASAWENCWLVQWGFETQRRLMWTKIAFCTFCYAFTFAGCILYGAWQIRTVMYEDESMTTHMDFAAKITGLPETSGLRPIEAELKKLIKNVTGQTPVGVSVAWDMKDVETETRLRAVLENELEERADEVPDTAREERKGNPTVDDAKTPDDSLAAAPRRGLDYIFQSIESLFLSPTTQWIITKGRRKNFKRHKADSSQRTTSNDLSRTLTRQATGESCDGIEEVDTASELKALYTCSEAFVVFSSEQARDEAVKVASTCPEPTPRWGTPRLADRGNPALVYEGKQLRLLEATHEPESVMWGNYRNYHKGKGAMKIMSCIGTVLGALLTWTVLFYFPYFYYAMSFNYAYGQEPGALEMLSFSVVVMAGNAIMYFVCSAVADRACFTLAGDREVCYFLLYTTACIFNVCLDLYIAYNVAYHQMVGLGMRTYYGTPLEDVKTFPERFETYAMQRELGSVLVEYSFPSTFLLPFLFEPIVTIYIPYRLMVCFVRSHPELTPLDCEAYLENVPMDLSRYADVLLNVMLATLILYFPGGFNLTILFGLVGSHIYIYALDHWRVLRAIPSCNFSKSTVDWWAQWMCSIPCGCMLSCLVFKASTERTHRHHVGKHMHHTEAHGEERYSVFWLCLGVFVGHVILHTLILIYVVPLFGQREKKASEESYRTCSERIACSWFSANPVHCLRSEYYYFGNADPEVPPDGSQPLGVEDGTETEHCDYCIPGKEHLIRRSPSWGVYWNTSKKSV